MNSTSGNFGSTASDEKFSTECFIQQGVAIKNLSKSHTGLRNHGNADILFTGVMKIVKYRSAKFIEWKPTEISITPDVDEWNVVDTSFQQNRNNLNDCSVDIKINLATIKSYKIKNQKKHQISILQTNGSLVTFLFESSPINDFVTVLNTIFHTEKEIQNHRPTGVILVLGERSDSDTLCQLIKELKIFPDQPPTSNVWRFINGFQNNPVEKTYEIFSKINDVLLTRTPDTRPDQEIAELLKRAEKDHKFSFIEYPPHSVLPPRPIAKPRGNPLDETTFHQYIDEKGQILNSDHLKQIIFNGGCKHSIRHEVWKFLLEYYPWNSTREQRLSIDKQRKAEYDRMKVQWLNMSSDQISRFNAFNDRNSLIGKDVHRTDRFLDFYAGEGNENIVKLHNILMTYVMYNFDLGYVQGMSDLLSPILMIMNSNEVESFWCFVGFMNRVSKNFELEQTGMKKQLSDLHYLLTIVSPELENHFKKMDASNMYFCFRWLLVWFKREFVYSDIIRLWEVLWTDNPCANFHLLICVAILDSEKDTIINENYGFNKILKHVNNLCEKIDLDKALTAAYGIYEQLKEAKPILQDSVKEFLGF